jgi:hypothetical protein
MRSCICTLIISLMAWGCTTADEDSPTTGAQGRAEIRVDTAQLQSFDITHVTVDAGGASQDLSLNPTTGTFDGTLILPAGPQSLVARAFAGEAQVAASNPTPVTVAEGVVTRVTLRILETTAGAPPLYGPIVDSLSYPTTTQAGAAVTLALSVVAPAGAPVTYAWSADCPDATFSAPQAATTTWSKATEGSCTIHVNATSNGFTAAQSFVIVVFAAGSASGGVAVSGALITRPSLSFSLPDQGCFLAAGGNASCSGTTLASPGVASYGVSVFNWGSDLPGTLELSDNCGGRFGASFTGNGSQSGSWLPPAAGGLCILTARAVNGDGLAGTLSAALLTRPGTPPTAQPPQINAQINNCSLASGQPTRDCGPVPSGAPMFLFGNVSWLDGHPASLTVTDNCGGGFTPENPEFGNLHNNWTAPITPGATCTLTIQATNLEGVTSTASALYHLL